VKRENGFSLRRDDVAKYLCPGARDHYAAGRDVPWLVTGARSAQK
jgi:hypothetical protein